MQGASLIWWCPHWSISWGNLPCPKYPKYPATGSCTIYRPLHCRPGLLQHIHWLTHYHVIRDSKLCFITFPYNFRGCHFAQLLLHYGSSCSPMDSALNVASIVGRANRCTVQLLVVWLHTKCWSIILGTKLNKYWLLFQNYTFSPVAGVTIIGCLICAMWTFFYNSLIMLPACGTTCAPAKHNVLIS